jgi:hypothetical protein
MLVKRCDAGLIPADSSLIQRINKSPQSFYLSAHHKLLFLKSMAMISSSLLSCAFSERNIR